MAGARDKGEDPVLDEALDWLLAIENAPADQALRRARDAWIAESDENARAWRRAERTWQLTGALAGLREAPLDSTVPKPDPRQGPVAAAPAGQCPPPRRRAVPRWAAAVAAAIVVGFLLAAGHELLSRSAADHATGTAEIHHVALPDGSRLVLGARSAVDVDFSVQERRIRLLSGAAFFDVRPDAARPFVVSAKDVHVTAVGTAFSVEIGPRWLSAAVAEGRVRLERPGGASEIAAGEEVAVDRTSGSERRRQRAPGDVAGWRERRLVADNETIADVVARLADHHRGLILTLDGTLAEQRVTGIYDLSRPVEALGAVVRPYGGSVHRITPYLVFVGGR